jgi:hypothetical protein
MSEQLQGPATYSNPISDPTQQAATALFEQHFGHSASFMSNVFHNDVSELAGEAIERSLQDGPLGTLEYRLRNADESEAKSIAADAERTGHGLYELAHALNAAIDERSPEQATVTLGVAETLDNARRSKHHYSSGYDNMGAQQAAHAVDTMYEVLGVGRPVVFTHGGQLVGRNQQDREVGPVSTSGLVSPDAGSDTVRVNLDEDTGAVSSVETATPFGITVIESWHTSHAGDVSSLASLRGRHHQPLRSHHPNDIGSIETSSTVHTVRFIKTPKTMDEKRLDEIAHGHELTPEAADLRDRMSGVEATTSTRLIEARDILDRLYHREGSKLSFMRPSKEKVTAAEKEQGKALMANQVAGQLRTLTAYSPKRTDHGFAATYTRTELDRPQHGIRQTTAHSLEVRPAEGGVSFRTIDEPVHEIHADHVNDYFLCDDGKLYSELTNAKGEVIRTEMDGQLTESLESVKIDPEWDYSPSRNLDDKMKDLMLVFYPGGHPGIEAAKRFPEHKMTALAAPVVIPDPFEY